MSLGSMGRRGKGWKVDFEGLWVAVRLRFMAIARRASLVIAE